MKIEYILVFREDGIPIYSHCFGMFCASTGVDDSLLSGFLSALTTMPQMFGQTAQTMQSVEMDFTKLMFSQTDNGKIIVIGVDKGVFDEKNDKGTLEKLFDKIEFLVDEEFSHVVWSSATNKERYEFEHKLVDETLPSVLDIYVDYCRSGEDCLFNYSTTKEEEYLSDDMTIWNRLEARYETQSLPWLITKILSLLQHIVLWADRRNYRNRVKRAERGV